ncbi:unnamed protein product [Cuscuta europaea]|uniref:Uncharacterized protein n=1 Tax=Cuscuta europaea TaxID=41803 RepID=A0A9P0Z2Y0_CUSEU|nr:unnamed protein product [Cuscuta europaea]
MGRGQRSKYPSVKLREFVTHTVASKSPFPLSSTSQLSSGTPFPLAHYINCDNFSKRHREFLAAVTTGIEPRTFAEAMKDAGWRQAMQSEIAALEDNSTWDLVPLPLGKHALGSK